MTNIVTYLQDFGKLETGRKDNNNNYYCELKYGNEVIRGEGKTQEEAKENFVKKVNGERNNLIRKSSDLEYIAETMVSVKDPDKATDYILDYFKTQTLQNKMEGGN